MSNEASERLKRNIEKIMSRWQERADKEILAALQQKELVLRDSLPEYLMQLSDALSTVIDRTDARVKWDLLESERVGKKHGRERAGMQNYTMDQMIFEYHILRQVIWDVMEEEAPLTSADMELITCSIEQAVNDAATEFSETLRDIQEKLIATLAHDLLNPLTSATLYAKMLVRRSDDKDYAVKAATHINNDLDRINAMIQNLLDVSRIKAGEAIPLQLSRCDLAWIASQVADEFSDLSDRPFIFSSDGPVIGYWSSDGLRRVIENLATNAVKYGAPNTPVTVKVEQTAQAATLTVHNLGNPIHPDELGILFQQYRRTRTAKEQVGWGVGLAVVKGITESLQGKVWVESSDETGTSFIIDLPKNLEMDETERHAEEL